MPPESPSGRLKTLIDGCAASFWVLDVRWYWVSYPKYRNGSFSLVFQSRTITGRIAPKANGATQHSLSIPEHAAEKHGIVRCQRARTIHQ
ncbi:hypothetical protein Bphy_3799 [Paraburkholderia phymatum STM815]|uniref:Uncharacterized protein n=1 Tax=Paraburkholderia phymatum (strain DSM 17167 / CIP 108236 / LMG 21445 / STM815) TaxID=391038 RepID=B2JN82_PARP8|nr:hypothetical protein Bphy_3799 [Paraburkholderia phymatum STM815]